MFQFKKAYHFYFYLFLTVLLLILILLSPFEISNDGRHYLAAAEALRKGGIYASLGYSGTSYTLRFMDDWPPLYPLIIAGISTLLNCSVFLGAKCVGAIVFLSNALLFWINFNNKIIGISLFSILFFLFNSSHFGTTNAEIFLFTGLLLIYQNRVFFLKCPFGMGIISGLIYLIKYSFLFIVPVFYLYIFFSEYLPEWKVNNFKNSLNIIVKLLLLTFGFLSPYFFWHYSIYFHNGFFFPAFLSADWVVPWYQYFADLVITWNLFPEQFEKLAILPGLILFFGILCFLFFDVVRIFLQNKKISIDQIFWHIPLMSMLLFYLLEAVLHGNSTKRYLEFSDLLFFIILCTALPALPWGRAYRYLAFAFMLVQVLYFFRVTIPRLPSLSLANMRENPVYQDMNERLANGEIERLYVIDLSFAGGVVNFENWDKVEKITVDGIPYPGERGFFLVQKRDMEKIRFAPPQARIIFVDR